jgi:hypothetical protein
MAAGRPSEKHRDAHRQTARTREGRDCSRVRSSLHRDALDGDLPALWREEDADARLEGRRRSADKAAISQKNKQKQTSGRGPTVSHKAPHLPGWEDFDAEGLLR